MVMKLNNAAINHFNNSVMFTYKFTTLEQLWYLEFEENLVKEWKEFEEELIHATAISLLGESRKEFNTIFATFNELPIITIISSNENRLTDITDRQRKEEVIILIKVDDNEYEICIDRKHWRSKMAEVSSLHSLE